MATKLIPRVTLDQWRVLQAIVDEGGFAQAAEVLHRSQSSVSYAARRLQELLGVQLFVIRGRRSELTEAGQVLLERSHRLLEQALALEEAGHRMALGWEANIRLVVENVFPADTLLETLKRFEPQSRGTRLHLREEVLSGVEDVLNAGAVDFAISPATPGGYLYEDLLRVRFIAVAHRDHALNRDYNRQLNLDDLRQAIHIVVRDTGVRARDAGWVQAEQKWTVSSFAAAIDMVVRGLGFAWLPEDHIAAQLRSGTLVPLRLEKGGSYSVQVNLIFANDDKLGPAASLFLDILRKVVNEMKEKP